MQAKLVSNYRCPGRLRCRRTRGRRTTGGGADGPQRRRGGSLELKGGDRRRTIQNWYRAETAESMDRIWNRPRSQKCGKNVCWLVEMCGRQSLCLFKYKSKCKKMHSCKIKDKQKIHFLFKPIKKCCYRDQHSANAGVFDFQTIEPLFRGKYFSLFVILVFISNLTIIFIETN